MGDVLSNVPAGVLTNGSAVALLVTMFLAVMRGWLVPGRTHDEMLKLHAERLSEEKARGDQWRAAWDVERARNEEQAKSFDLVLEAARTTNALVEGLKAAGRPNVRSRQ